MHPLNVSTALLAFSFYSAGLAMAQGPATLNSPSAQGAAAASQPPDFATMYAFENGYKNIVTLKSVEGKRIFRMEGERCFVEGTFTAEDPLGGQSTAWVLPAVTFARASNDEKFCGAGTQTPVLLHKEAKKSLLGTAYRVGEFKWGRFSGTFEVK